MNDYDVEDLIALHDQYVIPTYTPGPLLVKGKGCRVWDADGTEYLDFTAGIAVTTIGHAHPRLVRAIRSQASTLMHVSNLYYNEMQPRLARALSERSLGGKCFFCNSGAEANEGLIKLARLYGSESGRHEIITMRKSFHGRTLATLTATGQDKVKQGFAPLPDGFVHADFNRLESIREQVSDKTVAVLLEVVQGEGGVVPADRAFLHGVQTLCRERDLLLLIDEVQTGVGRTGHWFGYQAYGIDPDAIACAKGLGGGFPIGAVITTGRLADVFQPGTHATTFGGTPLACAAALAVIETIEKDHLLDNAAEMGDLLIKKMEKIAEKFSFVLRVQGLGLMVGLVLDRPAADLTNLLQQKGVLAIPTAQNVVRFVPPLNVNRSQVNKVLRILRSALKELR